MRENNKDTKQIYRRGKGDINQPTWESVCVFNFFFFWEVCAERIFTSIPRSSLFFTFFPFTSTLCSSICLDVFLQGWSVSIPLAKTCSAIHACSTLVQEMFVCSVCYQFCACTPSCPILEAYPALTLCGSNVAISGLSWLLVSSPGAKFSGCRNPTRSWLKGAVWGRMLLSEEMMHLRIGAQACVQGVNEKQMNHK